MCRTFRTGIAVVVLTCLSRAGVIGQYAFEEGDGTLAVDSSQRGNDARIYGGAARVTGIRGMALDLDGDDDYVDIALTLPREGSISLWYYPHRLYNYNTVFDNSLHENDWEMWIQGENIDQPWYECPYCWKFRLGGNNTARDVGRVNCDIRTIGGDKIWHYAVVTWESSGRTVLYLDGIARDTATSANFADAGAHVYLGGNQPGNPRGNGIIDEVIFFDHALSAGDVRGMHEQYTAPTRLAIPRSQRAAGWKENVGASGSWFDLFGRAFPAPESKGVGVTRGCLIRRTGDQRSVLTVRPITYRQ